MLKIKFLLLFLSFNLACFAQNSITIKGKIIDETSKLPLESATIYISLVKDSSIVDYTISNSKGGFSLNTKKIKQPVFLKISFVGYQDYKQEIKAILDDRDFGVLSMRINTNDLKEIILKNEAPPIRIKKDTLEFNASSFKIRPDANVETLLKQLPGVEIDADGKITVNGKEVNQVLVNGKPFFDKDGKIALQNLPSDIINKVQVTDTKTKQEELSKSAASSKNASINLTIDEKKNKGLFGKFMAGGGTDKRYESSALINYFKGKQKISLLASSNNINATGFSMDEIFDNMRSSRNNSFYTSSDGSFGINGMNFGGGKGITHSNLVGINFADQLAKNFDTSANYFFTSADSNNSNRTNQTNFLPDGNFTTNSNSDAKSSKFSHNLSSEIEYKIDSTASFFIIPKFSKSNSKSSNNSSQSSLDENNQLLNESTAFNQNETDIESNNNNIDFNKSFKKKGRNFSVSFENYNSTTAISELNNSKTIFYQAIIPNDERNQLSKNRNLIDKYAGEIGFTEPVLDSLNIYFKANLIKERKIEDRKTFDFDALSQDYSDLNDFQTNFTNSNESTIKPRIGLSVQKSKYNFSLSFGQSITQFDNQSLYLGNKVNLNKKYVLPTANINGGYNFTKSKSMWINYSYEIELPQANQILPVENLANPLNTSIGNVSLNPNKYHQTYLSFNNYDYPTRSGYYVYAGGSFYDSQIVSSTTFDLNRKRTTTFENINGTYNGWFGFSWNKSLKKGVHNFKYGVGLNGSYNLNKGFTDGQKFEARVLELIPRINLTYEYGELFTVNPTYRYTLNNTNFTNYVVNSASNFVHKFNVQTTNYWPKNWVFGNDFGYNYNSNIADGFKKDFYLLNTSLSYSFYQKKFMVKVKVYDLLNQNQNATRTITPTTIRDEENIVLKRYAMFSLTYKLEKFGAKEKKENNSMFLD